MAIYIKIKSNGEYHSCNFAQAAFGFYEMGAEIIKYTSLDDVYDDITTSDIVVDYIDQTEEVLRKFNIYPKCEDYPLELQPFMGRRLWTDTIDSINSNPNKWGIFVKPVRNKAFTGKVINSSSDLVGCGNQSENYEVLCCDALDIKREWRGFVKYDELLDLRPYTGDLHYNYNPDVVDQIMDAFRTIPNRPMGCSVDIAVVEKNGKQETIFLEMNDGYSLGNYGLHYLTYAKLLSARWSQLLGVEDEYDFRKYRCES